MPLPVSLPLSTRTLGNATSGAGVSAVPVSPVSAGGPAGVAPSATAGSNNANGIDPGGWDWSQALSGSAGYGAAQTSQNYIYNPTASNYQISGMPQYQGQQGQIASSYEGLQNTAANQTANLAGTAASQNAGYQSGVNDSTAAFLANAQGLGNYDSGLAGSGGDQQSAAYNAITNMAQGNGPSLAAKNLQAGLNSENQAIQAQSMSNQGLGGAGNATRNLLNAQAANANNYGQAAQQASVAEQLGALQQQSSQANAIRSSNQAQASAASSAGLAQRSLNAGALQTQYGAQLAGNSLADNTTQNAYTAGNSATAAGIAGQAGAYNNQFNANTAQQQANQAYDTALQSEGNTRAQINTNSVQSQASQNAGIVSTLGNIASGLAGGVASDQNIKTVTDSSAGTSNALNSILNGFDMSDENEGLDKDIANKPAALSLPQISALGGGSAASKSGGSGGGSGSSIGSALGGLVSGIIGLF